MCRSIQELLPSIKVTHEEFRQGRNNQWSGGSNPDISGEFYRNYSNKSNMERHSSFIMKGNTSKRISSCKHNLHPE
jgi:hypothetical protein